MRWWAPAWTQFWADGFLRVAFPPTCAACHAGADDGRLCNRCRDLLTADFGARLCPKCAGSIGDGVVADDCYRCRDDRFAFQGVIRLGRHAFAVSDAVLRMKRESGDLLAAAVGDLLAERIAAELQGTRIDAVTFVPHYWRVQWGRGYNPALRLAERIARRLDKPVYARELRRTRATATQHLLSPTERRRNVRDAFAARPSKRLQGANVILVDDVLTTGATCHHAAKALRAAGAARVCVAVVARGEDVRSAVVIEPAPQ